jgi:hypothetical protein
MFFRNKPVGSYRYLQIVHSVREGKKVRQQVIATLGRLDLLEASGQLERLMRSGLRHCESFAVIDAHAAGEIEPVAIRRIGPDLVLARLWKECGIPDVLRSILKERHYEFDVERAIYLTVLHRLFASGSDRAAERWREDYLIPGTEGLDLHHLYRAMAFLGEAIEELEKPTGAVRCTKDLVEEALFDRRRDLFSEVELVFFDTTSLYFEGQGGEIGQRGHNKDHRPDLKQMVVGMTVDVEGCPICCEMWPGNTADVTSLVPVIDRLRRRFAIGRVCVVADRGIISAETIAALEQRGLLYILGVRERTDKLVRDVVLNDAAPFVPLIIEKRGRDTDYSAKAVTLGGVRYIVCINHQEAAKDAADRTAILAALERQLHRGDKALVGNTGLRRFLKTVGDGHFAIDRSKADEDARFDGVFVQRTNTDLNPLAAMLRYKQLWAVEQTFRTAKHLLATRPIFHKLDETIRGHVFCSFLALVLKAELEARIAALGQNGSWPAIIADIDALTETQVEQDGKRFLLRSTPRIAAGLALRAAGVALPPTVQAIAEH